MVGLASCQTTKNIVIRGALLGFVVSGSLFLATSFIDIPGFVAGIFYGIVIEIIITRYSKKQIKK